VSDATAAVRNLKSTSPGQHFFGWWIVATTVFTCGMSVAVPYYNLPFFYDYFQKAHHWQLSQITLGFPVAAILTLWMFAWRSCTGSILPTPGSTST
jgi:hypothetical protein